MKKHIFVLLCVAACGGDDSASPDASPNQAAELRCIDFAYCSTYSVRTYQGTPSTPAGGTIADGVYRLAWVVAPMAESDDGSGSRPRAIAASSARRRRGGSTTTCSRHCGGRGNDMPDVPTLSEWIGGPAAIAG